MELTSQWNNSLQASSSGPGSNENMSQDGKSSAPEWSENPKTDSNDVNAKVHAQQIHGPGAHQDRMKTDSEKGKQGGDSSDSKGKPGNTDTSNGKPRGSSGKEMPGKGLGNSGKGPETYAREEDDSLPADKTGAPHKDAVKDK